MVKKSDDYAVFVALDPIIKNAVASFGGWEDSEGNKHYISQGKDRNTGEDIPYRFKFTRDKRFLTFHKNKKDVNGTSWVDFLRNHPYNANSPYACKKPWFKEMDNDRDAKVALDSVRLRNEAESIVLNLDEAGVNELANILGYRGTSEVKRHKVMNYASMNPSDFLDKYKDPNKSHESLLNACLDAKVITKHGFRFVYKEVHLGNKPEQVIAKIAEDSDLREALEGALGKAGR